MIKHYWTRFSLHYPTVLVYMLQSTDYRIRDYIGWLHRSGDFRKIIKRRQLDKTIKALLLLAIVWVLLAIMFALVTIMVFYSFTTLNTTLALFAVILVVILPLILAYLIVIPLWLGSVLVQKPHQRKLVSEAKEILSNHPGFKIAIAGSYGKTTAKEVLKTILSKGKKVASTPGNMNTPIGISRFARTLDGTEDILIFELGEEKVGDVRELCDLVAPDIGVITGINEAHLSSFGTIDKTVGTIFELQDYLGKKTLYKNSESPLVASKTKSDDQYSYSRKGTNGWKVSNIKTDIHGTKFTVAKGSKTVFAHTGLLGEHNVGLICAAVSIADSVGLTVSQIADGVRKTVPFEHRMQPRHIHGAWLIDDTYNGNSEGVQAGLLLLKSLDASRRVYVTPGLVELGDRTQQVHVQIGRQIAKVVDVAVLMKNSVTSFIVSGLEDEKFRGQLLVIDDPLGFYTNIDQFLASGDVVLMQNDWTDNYN